MARASQYACWREVSEAASLTPLWATFLTNDRLSLFGPTDMATFTRTPPRGIPGKSADATSN